MDARAFLDVEAAESDADDDDEEGQMDLEGGDFIALKEGDEGDEEPFTLNLEDTLRALSIVHENDNSWAEYINRARRRALEALSLSRATDKEDDLGSICMWCISVRRGREEDVAGLLGWSLIKNENETSPIRSIVGRRTSPGYILVETNNYDDVLTLCNGVSNIYGLPVQVPPDEVASWLRTAPYFPLSGSWVRITNANRLYKGDLAWVYDVTPHEGEVFLLYPPRFDRSVSNDQLCVKGKGRSRRRPPRGPLTFDEARRLFGDTKVQHEPEFHNEGPSQQECFSVKMGNSSVNIRYGFIYENTLAFEPTTPTDTELGEFFSVLAFTQLQFDPVCQVALNNMAGMRLQAGNCVRTVHGAGTIEGIYRDVASVFLDDTTLKHAVEIPLVELRPLFKIGDYVKVVHGRHWGKMGFVVGIDNIALTIHDHTQDIADPRCEVQVMVPLHGVQFHVEPKVIGSLPAPAGGSKLPLIKSRWDPFIGRRVRVIGQEKYKMFEGRIMKRVDNDDSKVEVEISAKLAFAKAANIVVPLAHLSD
ncbi:hypothetical protein H0H92_008646, partial [Tricholoma furcatifolium]